MHNGSNMFEQSSHLICRGGATGERFGSARRGRCGAVPLEKPPAGFPGTGMSKTDWQPSQP